MEFRVDKGTGYMYSYQPNHPCANSAGKVMEHVYVVWLNTGKILNKDECVHHKDRNKVNNDFSNLELMSRSDHALLHQIEDRNAKCISEILCAFCGDVFYTNEHNSIFCSQECARLSRRKFDIPKEELEKLVWEMPTTKIASFYGVSDKAVEKRCKLFDVKKPPRGYWAKIKLK